MSDCKRTGGGGQGGGVGEVRAERPAADACLSARWRLNDRQRRRLGEVFDVVVVVHFCNVQM